MKRVRPASHENLVDGIGDFESRLWSRVWVVVDLDGHDSSVDEFVVGGQPVDRLAHLDRPEWWSSWSAELWWWSAVPSSWWWQRGGGRGGRRVRG